MSESQTTHTQAQYSSHQLQKLVCNLIPKITATTSTSAHTFPLAPPGNPETVNHDKLRKDPTKSSNAQIKHQNPTSKTNLRHNPNASSSPQNRYLSTKNNLLSHNLPLAQSETLNAHTTSYTDSFAKYLPYTQTTSVQKRSTSQTTKTNTPSTTSTSNTAIVHLNGPQTLSKTIANTDLANTMNSDVKYTPNLHNSSKLSTNTTSPSYTQ